MSKILLLLCMIWGTLGFSGEAYSNVIDLKALNLLNNGDFSNGLSGWSIENPGNLSLGITSVDIDGPGPLQSSEAFFVQTGGGYGSPDITISQRVEMAIGGTYTLSASLSASYFPADAKFINNLSGGVVTVAQNGTKVDRFDFEIIARNAWEHAVLNASFEAASPGVLEINFFRPFAADSNSPFTYIDNVSLTLDRPATAPVPEPATVLLVGFGLAGLAGWRKKNGNSRKQAETKPWPQGV